jgi:hypothetical protein
MTRRLGQGIATLVLLAGVMPSVATAQEPPGDSVTGSGTATFISGGLTGLTEPFAIDIHAGPNGQQPTGTLTLLLTFTDPTCVVVRDGGGEAAPSAAINLLNPFSGRRVVFRIGGGESGPQLIGVAFAASASDCSFGPSPDVAEVVSGRIAIVDAPALPTSKEQCKNGGWRTFGIFKNQGDCVSFVATRGKNQPSGP